MHTISLRINNNIQKQLELKAKELNTDTNNVILKALDDFLYFERIKQLRSKLKKSFFKKGIKSEDNLFDIIS